MPRGRIKWFNEIKGYGYIEQESGEEDVFFHFSVIDMEGYKILPVGTEVEFEYISGEKGPLATRVTKIE
ncbi:MAG: cold shock domain-containing protein [Calditrichaeota bacterium]|nr:MAG: cold shock domain-containing protein [Calditrichota bacterium]